MTGRRDALIARRHAVGHTQETLADVLEVERSTVVRWELGTSHPSRGAVGSLPLPCR